MNYQLLTYSQVQTKFNIKSKKTFYDLVYRGIFRKAIVRIPGMKARMREDVLDKMIKENTLPELEV